MQEFEAEANDTAPAIRQMLADMRYMADDLTLLGAPARSVLLVMQARRHWERHIVRQSEAEVAASAWATRDEPNGVSE